MEIARASMGRSAARMGNREVISAVLKRGGMHTSSDFSFTSAMGTALDRRVRELYENLEMPLMPLTRSTLVNDFRPVETYSISGFPELRETPRAPNTRREPSRPRPARSASRSSAASFASRSKR
ncbi:hypothetical protein FLP41_15145 [Paracoccus marcusii]|uniref:hypothetical protein n=1 Tax=Paracoccus marcusii TaxID=59779 RepID=UPI002ED4F6EE|nr:hypothetical protein FLP41_15145 [Paracoccus marcusii]